MKRREELAQQYLQQANGDPRRAAELLQQDLRTLPLPVPDEEMVAHLMALEKLKELAERKGKGEMNDLKLEEAYQPLSVEDFKELVRTSNGGVHIWVKKLDTGYVTAALTDYHDNYGAVAIWCASSEADWLKAEDYGTKWVAYTSEPPEMREEEKPMPHLNGLE